jgi:hypothetical protein
MAGHKSVLEPNTTLRVGRDADASLSIPHDPRVSNAHLAISWDGERCRVRDLGSLAGTLLDGRRVEEADVENGAWLRLGDTDLMVYLEHETPPVASAPAPVLDAIATSVALREEVGPLFAVVDASRSPRPLALVRESVDRHRSLYDGLSAETLAHAAPYLVALRPDSGLLDGLVREGWGARWAIYLSSRRPFDEVRRHLRRFLMVEDDETGEAFYFRFYDPKTLRVFLPTCTPRQRADFFGETDAFFAEGDGFELRRFPKEPAP